MTPTDPRDMAVAFRFHSIELGALAEVEGPWPALTETERQLLAEAARLLERLAWRCG